MLLKGPFELKELPYVICIYISLRRLQMQRLVCRGYGNLSAMITRTSNIKNNALATVYNDQPQQLDPLLKEELLISIPRQSNPSL
jgi:hypothetical protein